MTTSYNDFVGEVQHRIDAGEQSEAVRTTRAVLSTLGERLEEGEATDLAGPLPAEIDWHLLQADHGQAFDYTEFVDRVVGRLDYGDLDLDADYGTPSSVDESEAVFRAQAVVGLVSELVPAGELDDLEAQLPDEYGDLFEFVDAETEPWAEQAQAS